jgi:hypothetical protein
MEKEEVKESVHKIFLVLDVSGSMTGQKLQSVTAIAQNFVRTRKGDLIGVIPFDDEVRRDLVVPLMTDTEYLVRALDRISFYQGGSTAIGEGLLRAAVEFYQSSIPEGQGVVDAARLREGIQDGQGWGPYASHVIRLLRGMENCFAAVFTDSGNNSGIDPVAVLKLYRMSGLKAYAIRIGVVGDEIFKQAIVGTGGQAYDAEDMIDVARFFDEINRIEKKEEIVDIVYYQKAEYRYPLIISLLCFLFAFCLRLFVLLLI